MPLLFPGPLSIVTSDTDLGVKAGSLKAVLLALRKDKGNEKIFFWVWPVED